MMNKIAEFFSKKQVKITLISVLAVLVIAAGFLWYIYPDDAIAKGVFAGEYDLSGLSVSEAKTVLANVGDIDEQIIVLSDASGASKTFTGLDILLCTDAEKTLDAAYKVGRGEGVFANILTLSKLLIKPYDVGIKYSYDEEKLEKIIYDFGVSVNGEMSDYTLEFKNGYVNVSKGKDGQARDVSKALELAKKAIDEGNYNIDLKMEKTEPPTPSAKGIVDYVYKKPEDATYTIENGSINITDEKHGFSISEEEANAKIDKLINGEVIVLKLTDIKPAVTKQDLYNKLFNHALGSFTSKYSASNKNRSQNVLLASNMINGTILAPGEVFSYNGAVGPRTVARGFKEATMYANGESVPGIGGGICQVSSTLYSAVLYSDLEIVERQNHSMTVDYMPKGQDATVSYGTIDFKFRNNTNNPVRISSVASGGQLTVTIYGTKPDVEKTVKIINNTVSVIEKTLETSEDLTLPQGKVKTISVGKTGYVIDTYKKVYENGVEVRSEYVGKSRYKMVPQKRVIGAAPSKTPAPTVSQAPTEAPEATDEPSVEVSEETTEVFENNVPTQTITPEHGDVEQKDDIIESAENI